MRLTKKKIIIVSAALLLIISGAVLFTAKNSFIYDNKQKMADMGDFPCDALEPGCGYCEGVVKDGYCYWND
jgi:hypothetical protein